MQKKIILLLLIGSIFTFSCAEPYALQTDTYESALVIEATLTDELKFQEIKLSRTYKLEEDGPDPETNAIVYVTDSNGNQYDFIRNGDTYISQQEFKALPNVNYRLHVVTSDGKTYTSSNEKINSLTSIDELIAEVGLNQSGETGVKIIAKSTKTSQNTEYYRYKYEETNKIIAPQWIDKRGVAVFVDPPPANYTDSTGYVYMEPWPYEAKTCYATENSKEIAISNTSLNSDNTSLDLVRFLNKTDYKIANRYSINVSMYNESLAAYNFYDALKKASTSGSLLSQYQPGFYGGNIKNANSPNEKIIGFFDVVHVSRKRIFFNFEELFPNQQKPDYPYYCPEITPFNEADFKHLYCYCYRGNPNANTNPCPIDPPCARDYILGSIRDRVKAVYSIRPDVAYLVNIQCGDCTSFSSNVRPSFWID